MRIFCAPVNLHPETKRCLERDAPDADIVYLKRGDKTAYWREIKKRWTGEEDLLIIEHDMEWEEGSIESIRDCERHWCSYSYESFCADNSTVRTVTWCLGFTKFSAQIQKWYPVGDIEKRMRECEEECGSAWYHVDYHIAQAVKHGHCFCCEKVAPHVHGSVTHHHDYEPPEPNPPDILNKVKRSDLKDVLSSMGWEHPEKIRLPG